MYIFSANDIPVCVNLVNVNLFLQLGSFPTYLAQCENVNIFKDKHIFLLKWPIPFRSQLFYIMLD